MKVNKFRKKKSNKRPGFHQKKIYLEKVSTEMRRLLRKVKFPKEVLFL